MRLVIKKLTAFRDSATDDLPIIVKTETQIQIKTKYFGFYLIKIEYKILHFDNNSVRLQLLFFFGW